jgi:hypothetical protein
METDTSNQKNLIHNLSARVLAMKFSKTTFLLNVYTCVSNPTLMYKNSSHSITDLTDVTKLPQRVL